MSSKSKVETLPTIPEIKAFLLLSPLVKALLEEIKELSKKKPDTPLNKLKIRVINQKLEPVKEIFRNFPIYAHLELLDEDTLPTNSDTVLIISQYVASFPQFKKDFYRLSSKGIGIYSWFTTEGEYFTESY